MDNYYIYAISKLPFLIEKLKKTNDELEILQNENFQLKNKIKNLSKKKKKNYKNENLNLTPQVIEKLKKTNEELEILQNENIQSKNYINGNSDSIKKKNITLDEILSENINLNPQVIENIDTNIKKLDDPSLSNNDCIIIKQKLEQDIKNLTLKIEDLDQLSKSNNELVNLIEILKNELTGCQTSLNLTEITPELKEEISKKKDISLLSGNFNADDIPKLNNIINNFNKVIQNINENKKNAENQLLPVFNFGQSNIYDFNLKDNYKIENFNKEPTIDKTQFKNYSSLRSYFMQNLEKNLKILFELKEKSKKIREDNFYNKLLELYQSLSKPDLAKLDFSNIEELNIPKLLDINEKKLKEENDLEKKKTLLIQNKSLQKEMETYKTLTEDGINIIQLINDLTELKKLHNIIYKYDYSQKQLDIRTIDKEIKSKNYNLYPTVKELNDEYIKMLFSYSKYFESAFVKFKDLNPNARHVLQNLFYAVYKYSKFEPENQNSIIQLLDKPASSFKLSSFVDKKNINKNLFYPTNFEFDDKFIDKSVDFYNKNLKLYGEPDFAPPQEKNRSGDWQITANQTNILINYYFYFPNLFSSRIFYKLQKNINDMIILAIMLQDQAIPLFLNNIEEFRKKNNLGELNNQEKIVQNSFIPSIVNINKNEQIIEQVEQTIPPPEVKILNPNLNIPPPPPPPGSASKLKANKLVSGTNCLENKDLDSNFIRTVCSIRLDKVNLKDFDSEIKKFEQNIENIFKKINPIKIKEISTLFNALFSFGILFNAKQIEIKYNPYDFSKHNLQIPKGDTGIIEVPLLGGKSRSKKYKLIKKY